MQKEMEVIGARIEKDTAAQEGGQARHGRRASPRAAPSPSSSPPETGRGSLRDSSLRSE